MGPSFGAIQPVEESYRLVWTAVERRCAIAPKWFQKAAAQGHEVAQFVAGVMYATGKGVPQNFIEAHVWINLAASRATGDYQKQFADWRDQVAKSMSPQQVAEARQRARDWKPAGGK